MYTNFTRYTQAVMRLSIIIRGGNGFSQLGQHYRSVYKSEKWPPQTVRGIITMQVQELVATCIGVMNDIHDGLRQWQVSLNKELWS